MAIMPACNAQGILANRKRLEEAVEVKWYDELVETQEREEKRSDPPHKGPRARLYRPYGENLREH